MIPELAAIKINQPAHRALRGVGIQTLEDLSKWKEDDLLALHGFGPKALEILKSTLFEYGLAFKA